MVQENKSQSGFEVEGLALLSAYLYFISSG
jgi:hypothetical protein